MGHLDYSTSQEKSEAWEVAMPLLQAMFVEFRELSKKKPDGAVSKSKIKIVNRLLGQCCVVLSNEQSIEFLDLLDEDEVPQHSDVVLMLSQYVASMEQFSSRYSGYSKYTDESGWSID